MSLYQNLYFMSVAGGVAGLISWVLLRLILLLGWVKGVVWADLAACVLLGITISVIAVAFSDYWSGNRVIPRWVVSAALIGLVSGLSGGVLQGVVAKAASARIPMLRFLTWSLLGCAIGLGLGLRGWNLNRARTGYAVLGGFAGGILGGAVFASMGEVTPELNEALGYVLLGCGICFGVTYAPMIVRTAVLRFTFSEDPAARHKLGKKQKEWQLLDGDVYVIGNSPPQTEGSRFRPEVEVYIPDALVAPKHASLFSRKGVYYLARHPDLGRGAKAARISLFIANRPVDERPQQLCNQDEIRIGRTLLRFEMRSV